MRAVVSDGAATRSASGRVRAARTGRGATALVVMLALVGWALPASAVVSIVDAKAITAGWNHTCALTADEAAICWGLNDVGQLGQGTEAARSIPMGVSGSGSGVSAIAAGGNHTCALYRLAGNRVRCWGENSYGETGTVQWHSAPDEEVAELGGGVTAIAAGGYHTCALTSLGGVKCWGSNSFGQLGDGTLDAGHGERFTPEWVWGLEDGSEVTAIAAGAHHTCAVRGGSVLCWGANSSGQLGDGTTDDQSTPRQVIGLGDLPVTAISAGWNHTCALSIAGGVKCWGANHAGQLGDGTTTPGSTPRDAIASFRATAIATGESHTCALTQSGEVKCWGANDHGQLGDGTTVGWFTPQDVIGLGGDATAIAAGILHTCAVTGRGEVKCWGANGHGQLGDGTTTDRMRPLAATLLSAPTVTTGTVSGVTADAATLNGKVSSNGLSTWVRFDWGGVFYGNEVQAAQSPLAAGATNAAVSAAISGLACGRVVNFRVVAGNAVGTTYGSGVLFATPECPTMPTATTSPPTDVTGTGATLHGTVSSNGASTAVRFYYGRTNQYEAGFATAAQSPLAAGASGAAVSAAITGLACGTTYHFSLLASNSVGGRSSPDATFTTAACQPPTVTTSPASGISPSGAVLRGTVSSNGLRTVVAFSYGLTTAYGTTVSPAESELAPGAVGAAVSVQIANLACNTTYHFRALAVNIGGYTYGQDAAFTTGACAPTATAVVASRVTGTGATLNGTVSSNGASTTVTFQYGPSTTDAITTARAVPSPLAAIAAGAPVSAAVTNLACNTIYSFRVVATNSAGTTVSDSVSFRTSICAPTATTSAASDITPNGATFNGWVSPNGASTTVTFEYGLTTSYGSSVPTAAAPLPPTVTGSYMRGFVMGLACNTTYHFRVMAANSEGTTNGADATFATAACRPPTATTSPPTGVTVAVATLKGTVNGNGAVTTVTFQYGPTTSYGASVPAAQSPLAVGPPRHGNSAESEVAVSAAIASLTCNATYHFRVVAANSSGTTHSPDATFTTGTCPPPRPAAATSPASDLLRAYGMTGARVTLNGVVSSNGASTEVGFEYGLTTAYGEFSPAKQSPLPAEASAVAVSATIFLACNTTWHFRVRAQNAHGTTFGSDATFTTLGCATPTVAVSPASGIEAYGATLNGIVSSNGSPTGAGFEYGPTTNYGTWVSAAQGLLSMGASEAAVSAVIRVTCNTTYHFRVVAGNSAGTTVSPDATFTTLPCWTEPTVTTSPASSIAYDGATLNAIVTSNGEQTSVRFEYGPTTSYGSTTPWGGTLAPDASGVAVSALTGRLDCNTTYHFRATAINGRGRTLGSDATFTTLPCPTPPTVTTSPASGITAFGATLNGTVSSNSIASNAAFDYGKTTHYGQNVPAAQNPLAADASGVAVSATIGGLDCNTTYHFRAAATNVQFGGFGSDATFTTAACPTPPAVTASPASGITSSSATLNGSVSSNGDRTTVSFQYGSTTSYDTPVPAAQSPLAAGASGTTVSAVIHGLDCETIYHFRAVATNAAGTTRGEDTSFTTTRCMVPGVVLRVMPAGSGAGTVTSSPPGIDCGTDCSGSYAIGTGVTLFASPFHGSTFRGWGGACRGTGSCTLGMSAPQTVTATFVYTGSAYSFDYVQKVYVAYYGRPADPAGQAYWAGRMDAEGQSLAAIIGAFGSSEEFARRYSGLAYADLVTSIYQQALGRYPDAAGLKWYVGELQAGRRTLQTITLDVLNGATTAPDSTVVANKLGVAAYYTAKVAAGCSYGTEEDGFSALYDVTANPVSVSAAKVAIDKRCGP